MTILYQQWRAEQAASRYPFIDTATLADDTDQRLPTELFLDAAIYAPGLGEVVWLTEILRAHDRLVVYLGDARDAQRVTGTISRDFTGDTIRLLNGAGASAGCLVVDPNYLSLLWQGASQRYFSPPATTFVTSLVVGLPAVATPGPPVIVARPGVQFTCELTTEPTADGGEKDVQLIRVHAVGDPLYTQVICQIPDYNIPTPVQQVRFTSEMISHTCAPDETGNVLIVAGGLNVSNAALRMTPVARGLVIGSIGAKP